jgi:hypothetical protein
VSSAPAAFLSSLLIADATAPIVLTKGDLKTGERSLPGRTDQPPGAISN